MKLGPCRVSYRTCVTETEKCCKVKLQSQATCHDFAADQHGRYFGFGGSVSPCSTSSVSPLRKGTGIFLSIMRSAVQYLACRDVNTGGKHNRDPQRPRGIERAYTDAQTRRANICRSALRSIPPAAPK